MKKIVLLILILLLASWAFAQEASEEGFDDFFATTAAEDEAAVTEEDESSYVWGGSFASDFTAAAIWDGWPDTTTIFTPDDSSFVPELNGVLFFNARISDEFRINLKLKTAYPFDTEAPVKIHEFFSDFQFENLVFFRVGKQEIAWGKGIFFSPADVLNLTAIDPANTSAMREGPLSLKTSIPVGDSAFYLFLIANNAQKPEDIAIAPKFDWAIGANEISFAGYYRYGLAPRAMVMASVPFFDIDFFGEVVVQYGSDRNWVRSTALPPFYEIYNRESELLASATGGFSFMNTDWNLFASAQYLYSMDGYADTDAAEAASALFMAEQFLWQGNNTYVRTLAQSDISMRGQHYVAASVNWSKAFVDDLSMSVFYIGNFTDFSGQASFSVSYSIFDHASVTGALAWYYGDAALDEFTMMYGGEAVKASIGFNLGTGNF